MIPHDVIFYTSSAGWIIGYASDAANNATYVNGYYIYIGTIQITGS
jgi:hypothetical protein